MYKSFVFAILLSTFFLGQPNPAQAQTFFNRNKCCCEEVVQNNRVIEEKQVREVENKQVQNKKQVVEQETTYKKETTYEQKELIIPQDKGIVSEAQVARTSTTVQESQNNTNYYRGLW
jgi:hypothetical protein